MTAILEFPRLSDRYPGWHLTPFGTHIHPGDPHPQFHAAIAIGRLAARGLLDPAIEADGLVAWALNNGSTQDYFGLRLRLLDAIKASAAHTTSQMQVAERLVRVAVSPLFDRRADTGEIEAAAREANADVLEWHDVESILASELVWWRRRSGKRRFRGRR